MMRKQVFMGLLLFVLPSAAWSAPVPPSWADLSTCAKADPQVILKNQVKESGLFPEDMARDEASAQCTKAQTDFQYQSSCDVQCDSHIFEATCTWTLSAPQEPKSPIIEFKHSQRKIETQVSQTPASGPTFFFNGYRVGLDGAVHGKYESYGSQTFELPNGGFVAQTYKINGVTARTYDFNVHFYSAAGVEVANVDFGSDFIFTASPVNGGKAFAVLRLLGAKPGEPPPSFSMRVEYYDLAGNKLFGQKLPFELPYYNDVASLVPGFGDDVLLFSSVGLTYIISPSRPRVESFDLSSPTGSASNSIQYNLRSLGTTDQGELEFMLTALQSEADKIALVNRDYLVRTIPVPKKNGVWKAPSDYHFVSLYPSGQPLIDVRNSGETGAYSDPSAKSEIDFYQQDGSILTQPVAGDIENTVEMNSNQMVIVRYHRYENHASQSIFGFQLYDPQGNLYVSSELPAADFPGVNPWSFTLGQGNEMNAVGGENGNLTFHQMSFERTGCNYKFIPRSAQ